MSADPQLPLEGMPIPERSSLDNRRAFGSVPGLLGREIQLPSIEHIDSVAFARVQPNVLQSQLFGASEGNVVDGVLLNESEYTLLVRSDTAFDTAIRARTGNANQLAIPELREHRREKSTSRAFANKLAGYEGILAGYAQERERLQKLLKWQQVPGYAQTDEWTMKSEATAAWTLSFGNILGTLAEHHQLDPRDKLDLEVAMAYKLFKGSQRDKVGYWGQMLSLSRKYNLQKTNLFERSKHTIERRIGSVPTKASVK